MRSKFLSYMMILCLIVTSISLIPTKALYPQPRVDLDEYTINVTSNTNVYVEGTVNKSYGQQISVRDTLFIPIAIGNVGNSGGKESFRIKIPSAYIKSGSNTFYVYSEAVKGKLARSNSKEFKVNYNTGKQTQTITASNKSVAVGKVISLGAKASSGLPLSYKSENPSIATVDMNGKVIGRKVGSTKIVISQDGNSQYSSVTKTIKVTVTKSNVSASNKKPVKKPSTYTVVYHGGSNIGMGNVTGKMSAQKITVNKSVKLKANKFKKTGYVFVGWATKNGRASKNKSTHIEKFKNINMDHFQLGRVAKFKKAYLTDKRKVKNLTKAGKTIHLYAVWKGHGPQAAVDWGRIIAADDNFRYGGYDRSSSKWTSRDGNRNHRTGCFMCKTNRKEPHGNYSWGKSAKKWNVNKSWSQQSKAQKYDKTWCCNPFVVACYVHGANEASKCHGGSMSYGSWTGQKHNGRFKKAYNRKLGDVYFSSGHVWMYAGNGQRVESSGSTWNKDSIRVKKFGSGGKHVRYTPKINKNTYKIYNPPKYSTNAL